MKSSILARKSERVAILATPIWVWHNFVEVIIFACIKKKEKEKIGEKRVKDKRKSGINMKKKE